MFVVTVTGIYKDARYISTTIFPKRFPLVEGLDLLKEWMRRAKRDKDELIAGFVHIKEQERTVGFTIVGEEIVISADRRSIVDWEQ